MVEVATVATLFIKVLKVVCDKTIDNPIEMLTSCLVPREWQLGVNHLINYPPHAKQNFKFNSKLKIQINQVTHTKRKRTNNNIYNKSIQIKGRFDG